jgi:sugar fermentation stimulation protein A
MKFATPLIEGRLLRRYQRFLADVDLGGTVVTAHCPNTGSLLGCAQAGSRVWLSRNDNGTRKHPHTWELVSP